MEYRTGATVKRITALAAAVLLLISLAGCDRYSSHYNATAFVHSNESKSAFMSFWKFEGRMVFKLKSTGEGDIRYSGSLEEGSAAVYYDYYGTKTELFTVSGGEKAESRGGYIETGTVYIIVETDGQCLNGSFDFAVE